MTTAQDKFDREGNFSNPNEMYFRFIQQGVSTEMAASQRVAEQAKEIGDQLKGDLKFEGTANSRGSVESPLATPGQGNSKDSISK